ncbi:hypothetical protein DTO207G8_6714 [Paecilomyces variotii]|nr:hypothetical protein DTO207G8_6714 [Paecilomyces variotii]
MATATAPRNPKDSMKSTWYTSPNRSSWTIHHWFYELLDLYPLDPNRPVPIHKKTDKVPYAAAWPQHRWILLHVGIPMLLHQLYVYYTGNNLNSIAAFIYYSVCFKLIGIHEIQVLRKMGHTWGFFDGDQHPRDGVPDVGVTKVVRSLVSTSTLRSMMAVLLIYDKNFAPYSINWKWLLLEIGLYGIILDFWFYWYHRLMHDIPWLWKYHRTHHLTKHPNPLLTLYADFEQEVFDIVGIPLMTFFTMKVMGFPIGFYEWWVCNMYVVWSELAGHSGLRLIAQPPSTLSWLLKYFNCELLIEDHDLHHRKGWRKSHNYGKQTRLWDRIFGTCYPRIEGTEDNIDYTADVRVPLW